MMISAQTARRAVWRPLWQLPRRFDLVLSLTRRELAARYKGSALGIAWAILTPVVMIVIFTIGHLQSKVWPEQFSMGLCALSFLWAITVERVSGIFAAIVKRDRLAG